MNRYADPAWKGLAHPEHQEAHLEPLIRCLRRTRLQAGKLSVHMHSMPFLTKSCPELSIRELATLLTWLQSRALATQVTLIRDARLIPELNRPEIKGVVSELSQSLRCLQVLRTQLGRLLPKARERSEIDPPNLLNEIQVQVEKASKLLKKRELESQGLQGLAFEMEQLEQQLQKMRERRSFFSELSERTQTPIARNPVQGELVLKALDLYEKAPEEIRAWRVPSVLSRTSRVRIEAWQGRARPILELRSRLSVVFDLSLTDSIEELKKISTQLQAGGFFQALNREHREGLSRFRALVIHGEILKETPFQMAARLADWIRYLEQKQSFDRNSDAGSMFGARFEGIDTDFTSALEANAWAEKVRSELSVHPDTPDFYFSERLVRFLFENATNSWLKSAQQIGIPEKFSEDELNTSADLPDVEEKIIAALADLSEIQGILTQLGFSDSVPFSDLALVTRTVDDIRFFQARVTTCRQAIGLTDSAAVDDASLEAACFYIHSVDASKLPEGLRAHFLTQAGPQRIESARLMSVQALQTLEALSELLAELNTLSLGESQALLGLPILDFCERLSAAQSRPREFMAYVETLREARTASAGEQPGLTVQIELDVTAQGAQGS